MTSMFLSFALAITMAAPVAGPVSDAARQDAMESVTKPLTRTVQDDRVAALTHLDDSLTLLQIAHDHLHQGERGLARAEVMGVSGKLSTAHMLLFKDKAFGRDLSPLTLRIDDVFAAIDSDPKAAADQVNALRNDLLGVYNSQTAHLGGGAGGGLEDLDNFRRTR